MSDPAIDTGFRLSKKRLNRHWLPAHPQYQKPASSRVPPLGRKFVVVARPGLLETTTAVEEEAEMVVRRRRWGGGRGGGIWAEVTAVEEAANIWRR